MDQKEFKRILARAVVLPLLLMAVVAAVLLWQISGLLTSTRWVEHTDRVIAEAHETQKLLIDMETSMRGYLITGNPVFLERYERTLPSFEPSFDHLSNSVSDNTGQRQRLAEIRPIHAEWQRYAREVMAMRGRGVEIIAIHRSA